MSPQAKLAELLKPRQPVYKRVKTIAEFCPVCKEQLQGNNSMDFPWKCSCGTWEYDWRMDNRGPHYYKIKIQAL